MNPLTEFAVALMAQMEHWSAAALYTAVVFMFTDEVCAQRAVYPSNYRKNTHISYSSRIEGSFFVIDYTFKDHNGIRRRAALRFDNMKMIEDADRFGIPSVWFSSLTGRQRHSLLIDVQNGFFKNTGWRTVVDYDAAVRFYAADYGKPIAAWIAAVLAEAGEDTRMNRIEFAMKFVQDIPYGVPEFTKTSKHMGGAMPPPLMLRMGFGDCDTKTMLFACIMCYLVDWRDVMLLKTHDHVLSAIRSGERPRFTGNVWSLQIDGGLFYLTETAGPARLAYGQETLLYQSYHVEKLSNQWKTLPFPLPYSGNRPIAKREQRNIGAKTVRQVSGGDQYEEEPADEYRERNKKSRGSRDDTGENSGSVRTKKQDHYSQPGSDRSTVYFRIGAAFIFHQGEAESFGGDPVFDSKQYGGIAAMGFPLFASHKLEVSAVGGMIPVNTARKHRLGLSYDTQKALEFWEAEGALLMYGFIRLGAGYGEFSASFTKDDVAPVSYLTASFSIVLRLGPAGVDGGMSIIRMKDGCRMLLRLGISCFIYLDL